MIELCESFIAKFFFCQIKIWKNGKLFKYLRLFYFAARIYFWANVCLCFYVNLKNIYLFELIAISIYVIDDDKQWPLVHCIVIKISVIAVNVNLLFQFVARHFAALVIFSVEKLKLNFFCFEMASGRKHQKSDVEMIDSIARGVSKFLFSCKWYVYFTKKHKFCFQFQMEFLFFIPL